MLYNIATATQSMGKEGMAKYADDSGAAVVAESKNFEQEVTKELIDQMEWYKMAGMTQEWSKTEVLPFKSEMEDVKIDDVTIKPTRGVKFLGVYLQADGKFGVEVGEREREN